MTFLELAEEVLKEAKEPLTYREIWEIAVSQGLDKKVGSKGKTPTDTLAARMYTDMKEKSDSKFCITSKRPTTFWLKTRKDEVKNIIIQAPTVPKASAKAVSFHERDLHPLLVKFLFESEEFDLYCKTIYHENSKKGEKGKDKWNYPDIVGIHFPFDDYKEETLGLLKNLNKQSCKIYSFEIKKSITWSDIKEYYFQAVSNSSWANEGYLVAFDIDENVIEELKRLNASFGIGVIQLDIKELKPKVILPSSQRELDIETLNMLVNDSPDFNIFIEDINNIIKAKSSNLVNQIKDSFDKVFDSAEELREYIEKNIR